MVNNNNNNHKTIAAFSQILGVASNDVPAYSNTSDEFFSIERHFLHGVFTGIKWQCVEYARRWLLIRKSCIFRNIGCAGDIWDQLKSVERVTDGKHFPLKCIPNGSPIKPKIDTFLIYCRSEEQPVGHIAVICDVGPDYIRIAEQNNEFHFWEDNYARQIPLICKDGLYYLEDEDPLFGWMEIENEDQLEPLDETDIDKILPQYRQAQAIGKLERSVIAYRHDESKDSWLSKDEPAENFFIKLHGEHLHRPNHSSESLPYYRIDQDFLFGMASASNDLHRTFLAATDHVLQDDGLLKRFCIPEIFWNRIRQSWKEEQNSTITGRFDLAFSGEQMKALEYNADSASALFECAVIQRKWAEHVNLPSTFTSGFRLHHTLVVCWKHMDITSLVHIMIDDDDDEYLTGLYMQNILKEAKIESKLCTKSDKFTWKNDLIVDRDDIPVKVVWKLWMWETVFADYMEGMKERGSHSWKPVDGDHARLSDILLHEEIRVFEPLWKVITSNKALLPVLYSMYPNHPLLLRSEWTITEELKQTGFVKKPIVGRCGQNVTLYANDGNSIIDERKGKFSHRHSIYQQLFHVKSYDGYHPIIGSWIIRGHFAGFCIREDTNRITTAESPITACCIIWRDDEEGEEEKETEE